MFRNIQDLVGARGVVGEVERSGYWLGNLPEPDGDAEARAWLNQLEAVFGGGITPKHAIDGVVSLTNDPTIYTDGVVRPQSDNGHQEPHTDGAYEQYPPRLMAVLCISPAETGGETLLVDMADAARGLDEEALRGLYVRDAIVVDRGDQVAKHPVFSDNGRGGTVARFSNHEYNRSYPGNAAAERGFTLIDGYLKEPANQTVVALGRHQLILIDNDRVTHGRNAFESRVPRHLLRKWYDGTDGSGNRLVDTGLTLESCRSLMSGGARAGESQRAFSTRLYCSDDWEPISQPEMPFGSTDPLSGTTVTRFQLPDDIVRAIGYEIFGDDTSVTAIATEVSDTLLERIRLTVSACLGTDRQITMRPRLKPIASLPAAGIVAGGTTDGLHLDAPQSNPIFRVGINLGMAGRFVMCGLTSLAGGLQDVLGVDVPDASVTHAAKYDYAQLVDSGLRVARFEVPAGYGWAMETVNVLHDGRRAHPDQPSRFVLMEMEVTK